MLQLVQAASLSTSCYLMPLLVPYKDHAALKVHCAEQGYRIDAVDHDDHTVCKAPISTQALAAYATT